MTAELVAAINTRLFSAFLLISNARWRGRIVGLALIGGGVWLSLGRRPG
jgi:hypothetical protein